MIVLAVVLAVFVGIALGLLGGGGSILAVPLLVYVAGLDAKDAIATSLLVVGVTSLFGTIPHARAGRVRWRTGLLFASAGVVGAFVGGRISGLFPDTVLLVMFAVMMLATAQAMIRGRRIPTDAVHRDVAVGRVLALGASAGMIAGLIGAGGGFLVVPALVLFGGLVMQDAVGTSLLVIAMNSGAGFVGHLSNAHVDWELAAAVTTAAVIGSALGGRWAGRVPQETLRRAFGWFVVAMGVFVLAQQVTWTDLDPTVAAAALVGAATVSGVGGMWLRARARRDREDRHTPPSHAQPARSPNLRPGTGTTEIPVPSSTAISGTETR